jgi:WbqC-like protein
VGKRVAIVQSNYIPWKGYFDLIAAVDEFILFDEVQYTRRDWRNRNRIKTRNGPLWLTIPVAVKGNYSSPIRDITVSDPGWNVKHWRTLRTTYARAHRFRDMEPRVEELYLGCQEERLSEINRRFLEAICGWLDIGTPLRWSWEYPAAELGVNESETRERDGTRTRRLAEICAQAGAAIYLSGPAAKAYLRPEPFAEHGIEVEYFDYSGYPEYEQLHPPFDHHVSVVDLLFNTGSDARRHLLLAQT